MNATAVRPAGRRAAVPFVLVSLGLDTLSLCLLIPVFPPLVQQFQGGDAASAGRWIGLLTAVWAVAQFFGSPIMGALSDRFGRRPVLLASIFGLGLDNLLMAFAPNLTWLFIGRVLSGFTASSFSVATAYIADVTPPEQRAARFGLVGAIWSFSFIVGPALGGLLGAVDLRLPFFVSAGVSLAAAVYGYFVLPESLKPEHRAPFSWRKANPAASLSFLGSHPELLWLSVVNFLMQFAHAVLPTLFVLYAGNRYGWSLQVTGPVLAATGVFGMIVQAWLVPRLVPRIGEMRAMILGLVAGALALAIYGLAPAGWIFLLGTPIGALLGLFAPGFQAITTRRVGPNEQGRLQGANSGIMGLTSMIAPAAFGYLYAASAQVHGGAAAGVAFLVAAGLLMLAALVAAVAVAPHGARESA
ncbi:TCR/Tet family MFS transporter [Phenylobacterium sp. LjRoot219]|uniref:TCR/Tet family MFS transporter n=1 Tax=Phenylobacterium sp. LjRoot219 TaxID=3342283 RepID=UPI003ECC964D